MRLTFMGAAGTVTGSKYLLEQDGRRVLRLFDSQPYEQRFEPVPGIGVSLRPAGHILGAASVHVSWNGGSVLFSGDLGRDEDLLMRPPDAPAAADYVVVESTY